MTELKKRRPDVEPLTGLYIVARAFDLVEITIRYAVIPFFFWLCVKELAGQETIVNVVIDYFSKGGNLVPWGLAGATSIWAYSERRLRLVKTARMSQHLKEVEKRLDPKRSSSGLTASGQTPAPGKIIPFAQQEDKND